MKLYHFDEMLHDLNKTKHFSFLRNCFYWNSDFHYFTFFCLVPKNLFNFSVFSLSFSSCFSFIHTAIKFLFFFVDFSSLFSSFIHINSPSRSCFILLSKPKLVILCFFPFVNANCSVYSSMYMRHAVFLRAILWKCLLFPNKWKTFSLSQSVYFVFIYCRCSLTQFDASMRKSALLMVNGGSVAQFERMDSS